MSYKPPTWGNYGPCVGGPYDGKSLHDTSPAVNVPFRDKRPITYFVPSDGKISDVSVTFGTYHFDPDAKVWRWKPPA